MSVTDDDTEDQAMRTTILCQTIVAALMIRPAMAEVPSAKEVIDHCESFANKLEQQKGREVTDKELAAGGMRLFVGGLGMRIVLVATEPETGKREFAIRGTSAQLTVFGGDSERDGKGEADLRGKLDQLVRKATEDRELTAAEAKLLDMAGSLEIAIFVNRVKEIRKRLESAETMDESLLILKDTLPLRREFSAGLHGKGSLYANALEGILADRGKGKAKDDQD